MAISGSNGSSGHSSGEQMQNQSETSASEANAFKQFGPNAGFVRDLYALFLQDSSAVGEGWAEFFSNLGNGSETALQASMSQALAVAPGKETFSNGHADVGSSDLVEKILALTQAYRTRGHLIANINPLASTAGDIRAWVPQAIDLSPAHFGISSEELNRSITIGGQSTTVSAWCKALTETYTHTIGFEYAHLLNEAAQEFLRTSIENSAGGSWRASQKSAEQKRSIYKMLVEGETLESELHKKFVGQKRFSLQGGESLMPMLDTMLVAASKHGVKESIFGMAHRGRLDVLASIVGKPIESLFNEFLDNTNASIYGDGDVKYHLGSSAVYAGVNVTLAPNPSHLEFVNAVVEGISRARQDIAFDGARAPVLPVVIHGDAAFAGQGCVFETLMFSNVPSYTTGGTIHIVINNQVGFTALATETRSTVYCSDMAKGIEAPVFHVNGDDPEACCWAMNLALEYRMKFARDVIIDMYCYRKYGHNEGDDPTFTQPLMYKEIQAKKSVMSAYGESLVAQGVLTAEAATAEIAAFKKRFGEAEQRATQAAAAATKGSNASRQNSDMLEAKPRTVQASELANIAAFLVSAPSGFEIHPKLKKILEKRNETLAAGVGIEWGLAEALAFGCLLNDGVSIRLSGQDCGRGTFSHRHLLLSDFNSAQHHAVLEPLAKEKNARFDIINSILSESAVMGFEFGYAATAPKTLVLWEAQFGDFANGAQVVIDQFLAASETKWKQSSGLTLLLPHGSEGQGPEHSSARLERFLQLCAQNNMTVCNPTSAAQIFHLLRLQGAAIQSSTHKRPLVVMSPKSLLRAPHAASVIADLCGKDAGWKSLITNKSAKAAETIIGCSGKIYFDIAARVKESGAAVDIVRIEQLYPLPIDELKKIIGKKKFIWVQEEPENMGAFRYIQNALAGHRIDVKYAGRRASAAPATGSMRYHTLEQKKLVDDAMALVGK